MTLDLDSDEVTSIWERIKERGTVYTVIGLADKIKGLNKKIKALTRDNQDLRSLISDIRDRAITDQAYLEVQKIIIENREVIKANDTDVWNIHRRIDMLQKQVVELQSKNKG